MKPSWRFNLGNHPIALVPIRPDVALLYFHIWDLDPPYYPKASSTTISSGNTNGNSNDYDAAADGFDTQFSASSSSVCYPAYAVCADGVSEHPVARFAHPDVVMFSPRRDGTLAIVITEYPDLELQPDKETCDSHFITGQCHIPSSLPSSLLRGRKSSWQTLTKVASTSSTSAIPIFWDRWACSLGMYIHDFQPQSMNGDPKIDSDSNIQAQETADDDENEKHLKSLLNPQVPVSFQIYRLLGNMETPLVSRKVMRGLDYVKMQGVFVKGPSRIVVVMRNTQAGPVSSKQKSLVFCEYTLW